MLDFQENFDLYHIIFGCIAPKAVVIRRKDALFDTHDERVKNHIDLSRVSAFFHRGYRIIHYQLTNCFISFNS